jgi:hypothetical protein
MKDNSGIFNGLAVGIAKNGNLDLGRWRGRLVLAAALAGVLSQDACPQDEPTKGQNPKYEKYRTALHGTIVIVWLHDGRTQSGEGLLDQTRLGNWCGRAGYLAASRAFEKMPIPRYQWTRIIKYECIILIFNRCNLTNSGSAFYC